LGRLLTLPANITNGGEGFQEQTLVSYDRKSFTALATTGRDKNSDNMLLDGIL